ncbi:MAG: AraD1 family protein [Balneolaceae bacterium]
MRLVQLYHPEKGRRIAKVEKDRLILFRERWDSTHQLFTDIIESARSPETFISAELSSESADYDNVYSGTSQWKLLPPFDHPDTHHACMLSGTGLTHRASAENREKMHQKMSGQEEANITDSMKIYMWGEEGGKPKRGDIGVQPEWFYKGNGTHLKACGEPLIVPTYADDGGEEPEIAGLYLIARDGTPFRVGFAIANEFSDHVMEKKNYLYLAPSKLRNCSIGPELVVNGRFDDVPGVVSVERDGGTLWSKEIRTGEKNMCHSLENLEHHHFKYNQHRIPGTVHVHFFGAGAFTFGEGIELKQGDRMSVSFEGYGRPLVNPLQIESGAPKLVKVKTPGQNS